MNYSKLLVVALKPEWNFLKSQYVWNRIDSDLLLFTCDKFPSAALLQTGPGPINAINTFRKFLNHHSCQDVLHFGTCGALIPSLQYGDIVTGPFYTVSSPLKNIIEKSNAAKESGAIAVDMESHPIAELCRQKDIPYHGLRAVFDRLDDDLEDLGEPYSETGEIKPSVLAVNILKNPQLIFKLPGFKKRMDQIARNLRPYIETFLKS